MKKKERVDDMESTRSGGGYNNHYVYFSNPIGGMAGIRKSWSDWACNSLSPVSGMKAMIA